MLPDDPRSSSPGEGPIRKRLRGLLFLLVVPALLIGPTIFAGERFLPYLPRGHEPLRGEDGVAAEAAFRGANYAQSDRIFPVLTDQRAMATELARGHLPTWQPLQGMGAPLFGGTIAAAAYPPNWLAFLLPPEHAAGVLALLALVLAGAGMWLFLRRLGLPVGACAVGALALQLGGWGVANLFYPMKVDAALWIPWALWAVEGIAQRRRGSAPVLTVAVALSLLAGFVPIAVFGLGLIAAWAVFRLTPLWRAVLGADGMRKDQGEHGPVAGPRLVLSASFAALALLVAAVQLLPSFEASRQSARNADVDPAYVEGSALPSQTIVGAVIPDFVGAPTESTLRGHLPVAWWLTPPEDGGKAEVANQLEWNTYAGAVVVLLALAALLTSPRRAAFPLLALLVVLGFAFAWPGVRLLYGVPGLNLGDPGRILSLAWILWPWLAALGVEALLRRRRGTGEVLLLTSFLFTAGAFFVWHGFDAQLWADQFEQTMVERYVEPPGSAFTLEDIHARVPPAAALAAGERLQTSFAHCFAAGLGALLAAGLAFLFDHSRRSGAAGAPAWVLGVGLLVLCAGAIAPASERALANDFGTPTAFLAGGAVLFLALLWWRPGARGQPAVWLPLAAAVAIEGVLATTGHLVPRPPEAGEIFPESEAMEAIREAAGDGRVLRYDSTPTGTADAIELARPNLLEAYGIADLTPYIVFTPRTLIELVTAVEPAIYSKTYRTFSNGLRRVEDVDHPIFDLQRATVVLSRHRIEHPRLEPVLSRPGFFVYRRAGALPAGRVVPRAVPSGSDEAVLQTLHSRIYELAEATLLAPEHSSHASDLRDAVADWKPGRVETVRRPAGNHIEYEVWGSSGGWFVMHDQYYPGWKAQVNGEDVPLLRADHACRAVRVPAGDSTVILRYAPGSLRLGFFLSLGAGVVALFLARRFRL